MQMRSYVGFKCRECAYLIPVFSGAGPGIAIGDLRVMCPQCGACESHASSQARCFEAMLDVSGPHMPSAVSPPKCAAA